MEVLSPWPKWKKTLKVRARCAGESPAAIKIVGHTRRLVLLTFFTWRPRESANETHSCPHPLNATSLRYVGVACRTLRSNREDCWMRRCGVAHVHCHAAGAGAPSRPQRRQHLA